MNELDFDKDELLEMYKLKNIVRYNHRTRLKDENVAEHSFFTTIIALEVCKRLKVDELTVYLVTIKSLLHDLPETVLNDITYDVKLKLGLYPVLKQYEDEYYDENYPEFATIMKNDEPTLANLIFKYADAMSVLQYAYNELELGNVMFEQIKDETITRLNILKSKIQEALLKWKNSNPIL